MKIHIHAVLTGDIVRSTSIEADYKEKLLEISGDIKDHVEDSFQLEIYRGDSFQGIVVDPLNALRISLLIRGGLRRYSRKNTKSIDSAWDARISIGIGGINNLKKMKKEQIGILDGDAFVRSGKALDGMKGEKSLLKITTGIEELDDEFYASCALADAIVSRWSVEQAEAIYLYLLENLTQEEIGKRLEISQRAVGKRMMAGNMDNLKKFLERYQTAIEWKYSN